MAFNQHAPSLRVLFPGVLLDPFRTVSATLVQESMTHDVLKLKVAGQSFHPLAQGAPVHFEWKSTRGRGVWCGYVHRVDPSFRKVGSETEILCVGLSYPLMSTGVDTWAGVKAGDVVKDIARMFRLTADVEDHPMVFPQISQAGDTYWQLLVRLADQLGYVVLMDGAAIVFRSRSTLARNWRPQALDLRFDKRATSATEVLSFAPRVGAFNPTDGGYRYATTSGVDAVSGTVTHAATGTRRHGMFPGNIARPVSRVATSAMEARSATAAAQDVARYPLRARLTSVGDPHIRPERYINVRGVDAPYLWLVRKVEHEFTVDKYASISELISDGANPPPGEPVNPDVVDPHRPGALQPNPAPVLVNHRDVVGAAGSVLGDVYWSAPVINWRN